MKNKTKIRKQIICFQLERNDIDKSITSLGTFRKTATFEFFNAEIGYSLDNIPCFGFAVEADEPGEVIDFLLGHGFGKPNHIFAI